MSSARCGLRPTTLRLNDPEVVRGLPADLGRRTLLGHDLATAHRRVRKSPHVLVQRRLLREKLRGHGRVDQASCLVEVLLCGSQQAKLVVHGTAGDQHLAQ